MNQRLDYRNENGWMLQSMYTSRDEVDIAGMRRYTGLTLAKWTITITIGILVGKIFVHLFSSSLHMIEKHSKIWEE